MQQGFLLTRKLREPTGDRVLRYEKHSLLLNKTNKGFRWPAMAETIVFSSGIQEVMGKLLLLYYLLPYNILIIR